MKSFRLFLNASILLLPLYLFVACSPASLEVQGLFQYINEIKAEMQSSKSEEKKQAILSKARKRILTMIDTEYVAQLSMGKHFENLSKNEKKEFVGIFHELMAFSLVKTYIPIATIVENDINVEFMFEEIRHDRNFNLDAVVIHTKFVNAKVSYFIDFYLHQVGKKYKLYDVYVDGASVLLDYRLQFSSIIESKGFPYLLDRLKSRLQELNTALLSGLSS